MTNEDTPDVEAVEAEIIPLPVPCVLPSDDSLKHLALPNREPIPVRESRVPPEARLVTVKDVQRILSVGRTKAFDLMAKGTLERRRIDGCTRITMRSVMAVVEDK